MRTKIMKIIIFVVTDQKEPKTKTIEIIIFVGLITSSKQHKHKTKKTQLVEFDIGFSREQKL